MSNTVGRGRGPMGRRRGMSGEKAKDFKDAMLRLLKYIDRKSTRLNSSHANESRMPSSA